MNIVEYEGLQVPTEFTVVQLAFLALVGIVTAIVLVNPDVLLALA